MSRTYLFIVYLIFNIYSGFATLAEIEPNFEPVKDVAFIKIGTYRKYCKQMQRIYIYLFLI